MRADSQRPSSFFVRRAAECKAAIPQGGRSEGSQPSTQPSSETKHPDSQAKREDFFRGRKIILSIMVPDANIHFVHGNIEIE